MKIIKASAFLEWKKIPRCQKVPYYECLRVQDYNNIYLVAFSHRWETEHDPDPEGDQLREAQSRLRRLCEESAFHTDDSLAELQQSVRRGEIKKIPKPQPVGVFYDFCSLDQKPRTKYQDETFRCDLLRMHEIYSKNAVLVISDTRTREYLNRAWCFAEYFIGLSSGTLVLQDDQDVLENSSFRQLRRIANGRQPTALSAERVRQDNERTLFFARILRKMLYSLTVTNGSDKTHILCSLLRFIAKHHSIDISAAPSSIFQLTLNDSLSNMNEKEKNSFDMDFDMVEFTSSTLENWNRVATCFHGNLDERVCRDRRHLEMLYTTEGQLKWWREHFPEEASEAAPWYVPTFVGARMEYDMRGQVCPVCDGPACQVCGVESADHSCDSCFKKLCGLCPCPCKVLCRKCVIREHNNVQCGRCSQKLCTECCPFNYKYGQSKEISRLCSDCIKNFMHEVGPWPKGAIVWKGNDRFGQKMEYRGYSCYVCGDSGNYWKYARCKKCVGTEYEVCSGPCFHCGKKGTSFFRCCQLNSCDECEVYCPEADWFMCPPSCPECCECRCGNRF